MLDQKEACYVERDVSTRIVHDIAKAPVNHNPAALLCNGGIRNMDVAPSQSPASATPGPKLTTRGSASGLFKKPRDVKSLASTGTRRKF